MCMTPGQPHLTLFPYTTLFRSGQGRPTGMLDGYQPGDPVVRVFTYQAAPVGSPEEIAEEAFAICNGHPASAARTWLAAATSASCGRCHSPETHRVAAGRVAFTVAACGPDRRRGRRAVGRPARLSQVNGGRADD